MISKCSSHGKEIWGCWYSHLCHPSDLARTKTMKQKKKSFTGMITEMVSNATVTIINETSADIHARVTATTAGMIAFFDISPGESESWLRSDWQVAFVLRDDTGATETLVVKAGSTYTIS